MNRRDGSPPTTTTLSTAECEDRRWNPSRFIAGHRSWPDTPTRILTSSGRILATCLRRSSAPSCSFCAVALSDRALLQTPPRMTVSMPSKAGASTSAPRDPPRRRPPTLDQRSSRTTMEWPEMARISSSDAPASANVCSADPLRYIASMAQQPCDGRCRRPSRLRQSNPKWLAPSPRVHRYGTACAAYASICADRHHRGSAPWRNLW